MEEPSHHLSLRYCPPQAILEDRDTISLLSQECLSHDFSRESQWPELHLDFKYHNLLHVWTTRRVQKAVSGGRERVSDSDQTTDVVMRAPRSRRAPAAGRKKRVHRLPLLEGATCSVQIGERREETFLIRKHLLHLEAPCLRSKVIHRPRPCHHVVRRRGVRGNQAWPEMILSTLQCDCNPISHQQQHIVSSSHKC